MKKRVLAILMLAGCGVSAGQTPFQSVNLLSGTANDGQTVPMVGMPFAMTNWVPETRPTEDKCIAPYYFKDRTLSGFRASHWMSGSCTQDYGSVTFMPITGALQVHPSARASEFRRQSEIMNPAYYSVLLDRYAERVEMTGSTRSGALRVTAMPDAEVTLLVEPNTRPGEGFVEVHADRREIVGFNPAHRIYQGSGQTAGFSGYFVARFSRPVLRSGTWCGLAVHPHRSVQKSGCNRLGAYATFAASKQPLLVKIGTSFTSLDEAQRNLDAEQSGWDFEGIEAKTEAAWKERLGRIEVEGGTTDQRKTFYTAFYHASLLPRIASDVDGTYNGFAQEGKLHSLASGSYYDDFSLWDTFRALHPLLTIIDPEREQEMVQSLVLKGEQGGFLPIFPAWNNYTSEMIGDHADAVIADAYAKGLTHFDVASAYRLMLKNASVTPPLDEYRLGRGRRALASYERYGFIPLEDSVPDAFHHDEQVSRTLEYAYDDSLVATMARRLNFTDDAAKMEKRAENWRNVIDPATGYARGRHSDGSWVEPFEPAKTASFITEGLPWQYTFFVPQNIPGLIAALGGREKFLARLDGLFDGKLYDQGNEPGHHIAYLYDYADAPSKTQHQVRAALSLYRDGPGGLPGNDDAGQMSAWMMMSAMGFYPVDPGSPEYAIGAPLFSKVTIHQRGGHDFIIEADHQSTANEYVQSQWLNGASFQGHILPHAEIIRGGILKFDMGSKPRP